ncbi:MAG: molecular chaperone DnaJ [Candidatus Omnitrophota bacterium]|nr:molecular chaperone DnaJ [Candidatus Omnitrophota bacterium]
MSAKRDYYEILGVPKNVTVDVIKKSYRTLALKYHPDRVAPDKKKEAEEQFKEISEAYAVLSDTQKRALYDQYGHSGIDQRYTSEDIFKGADFGSIFENAGFESMFGDVFSDLGFDIFGGGGRTAGRRRSERGRDIQIEVDITFLEAARGVTKQIKYPRYEACSLCKGTGAKPGSKKTTCSQCKGQGQVIVSGGFFRMAQTCPQCRGEGTLVTAFCPDCNGQGKVKKIHKLEVKVPPGVDTGSQLRIRGEGEAGKASKGDLYIILNVFADSKFERSGNDIVCEVNISMAKATLGGEVEVSTLDGSVMMKIPVGTQPDKVFRLRQKGIPDLHGYGIGDQLVKVKIEIPVYLTVEQRKLIEDFAKLSGERLDENSGSFTEKIKKVFK